MNLHQYVNLSKRILTVIICLMLFGLPAYASPDNHIYAANRNAGKLVALTFDDGPHPVYTGQILDILKIHNASATFFVIGKNAEEYPELIKREVAEGHEIGNHTYSHPNMKNISVDEALDEIKKTQDIIFEIAGESPVIFRSPGGIFSEELVGAVMGINCKSILWSWKQDTRDWSKPGVKSIVDTVINNINDGDIILFHDYNSAGSPTPAALEIIIPKLKEMGYSFVTVSELIAAKEEIV